MSTVARQVTDRGDEALGGAGPDRDERRADVLDRVLQREAADEEAQPETVDDDVLGADALARVDAA